MDNLRTMCSLVVNDLRVVSSSWLVPVSSGVRPLEWHWFYESPPIFDQCISIYYRNDILWDSKHNDGMINGRNSHDGHTKTPRPACRGIPTVTSACVIRKLPCTLSHSVLRTPFSNVTTACRPSYSRFMELHELQLGVWPIVEITRWYDVLLVLMRNVFTALSMLMMPGVWIRI